MARGFNKVMIMGNVVRDPDVRSFGDSSLVARFTVAVGYKYKNRNGDVTEHTDFISCAAWGGTAKIVQQYVKKGNPLFVEGRLSCRDFDDPKTGQHRWVTEVNAESVVLLGKSAGAASAGTSYSATDLEADVSDCMRLQEQIYGARGMKQGATASESMSMRQETVIPADDCGYGPFSPEGQDMDIPF